FLIGTAATAVYPLSLHDALPISLGRQGGGERKIAAGQPLADRHEIGPDALVLTGKHPARAAKAGSHLVGDQQHAVACAQAAERADRKSTRLNSSHVSISYAVFCL